MRAALIALIAIFTMFGTHLADAGCDECPFPVMKLYGEWSTPHSDLILDIHELREGRDEVYIGLTMRRAKDGVVVARGRTVVKKNVSSFTTELHRRNGRRGKVRVELMISGNSIRFLTNLQFAGLECDQRSGCLEFDRRGLYRDGLGRNRSLGR